MIIKRNATIEFIFPKSSKSGVRKNSIAFIVAIIIICVIAQNRDLILLKTQIPINTSQTPMAFVKKIACSLPKMRETICECLGTRFKILQKSPLIIQTEAIKEESIW